MSKGNLFLGFGRGKVGDVVFSRVDGQQVARARNHAPKNPKTALQLAQRVFLKTSAQAYSLLQPICNHSFEGFAEGTPCQSRFTRLNVEWMRRECDQDLSMGDEMYILTSQETNYSSKASSRAAVNGYQVSEGHLPIMPVIFATRASVPSFILNVPLPATPTYQDVCDALNLMPGDQLTFLCLSVDDTEAGGEFNSFEYCRVILNPGSGDMTAAFLDGDIINDPNGRNDGDFSFALVEIDGNSYLSFISPFMSLAPGAMNTVAAAAVIASRQSGELWQRSKQFLQVRSSRATSISHLNFNHEVLTLGDAVQSYSDESASSLYLNQAGHAQSANTTPAAAMSGVTVNGDAVARGATKAVEELTSLTATMRNAEEGVVYGVELRNGSTVVASGTFSGGAATVTLSTVADGTYTVVFTADSEVVSTYCTIRVGTVVSGTITAMTVDGTSLGKNSERELVRGAVVAFTAQATDIPEGATANLIILNGSTTVATVGAFSSGSTSGNWTANTLGYLDLALSVDGTIVDRWGHLHVGEE